MLSRPLARKSTSKHQTVKRSLSTSNLLLVPSSNKLRLESATGGIGDGETLDLKGGVKRDVLVEGQWEAPWLNLHLKRNHTNDRTVVHPSPEKHRVRQSGRCVRDVASCLLKKLGDEPIRWSDKKGNGRVQTEKMRNTWSSLARQQSVQCE